MVTGVCVCINCVRLQVLVLMFSFLLNNVLQSCTSVVAPYDSIISHRFLSSSNLVSDIRSFFASHDAWYYYNSQLK